MVGHIVLGKIAKEEAIAQLKKHTDKKYRKTFYEKNLSLTKKQIASSVGDDQLLVQAAQHVEELQRVMNTLAKRLREWYAWYAPEVEHHFRSHEEFVEIIRSSSKQALLKQLKIQEPMGAELSKKDVAAMLELARLFVEVAKTKKTQEQYIATILERHCPNVTAVAGEQIAAKLLVIAGSLRRLMLMPASTIQLLGAEKSLFRHLRSKAKPPKYGVLLQHPIVQKADTKDQGKRARLVADKICIAAKVDFFKGEFVGKKLLKDIEEKCRKR